MKFYRQKKRFRKKGKVASDKSLKVGRSEDFNLLFSADNGLCGKIPEQAEYMIAVQVTDKDLMNTAEANTEFSELDLRTLPAIN